MGNKALPLIAAAVSMVCMSSAFAADRPAPNPMRNAYFGAVHIHTGYSFDALTNGTITTPSNAYEWAQGKPIPASKFEPDKMMKIVTPLDFYAVSDHAEFMGVFNKMADPKEPLSKTDLAKRVNSSDPNTAMQAFAEILRDMSAGKVDPMLTDPAVSRTVWAEIVKTADAYYRPGSFTTFPAFEWTSNPNKRNLHRVVVFRDSKHVPDLVLLGARHRKARGPLGLDAGPAQERIHAARDSAQRQRQRRADVLVDRFERQALERCLQRGARAQRTALRDLADQGHVGDDPALSPNDEFAGFELWDYTLSADAERPTHAKGATCGARCSTGSCCHPRARGIRSSTVSSATRTRTTRQPRTRSSITPASSASNPIPSTA